MKVLINDTGGINSLFNSPVESMLYPQHHITNPDGFTFVETRLDFTLFNL